MLARRAGVLTNAGRAAATRALSTKPLTALLVRLPISIRGHGLCLRVVVRAGARKAPIRTV